MKALIVALCIAAAIAAGTARSPFANATPSQDQQFVAMLNNDGLYVSGPGAITVAHQICADVWTGTSPNTEVAKIWKAKPEFTWDDATHIVFDAIVVYCPPAGAGAGSPSSAPSQGGSIV